METPRPHQNSVSNFPRREIMQDIPKKDIIPKSPLLFYTPLKKPCSQLAKNEDGERHTSLAKENAKAAENLVVARTKGANVHNSTCSTPVKTPFGTPSQLQTLTPKLSFLSASGNKHSVGAAVCGVNEDASITRTPFRLLAGKNLNACLFSPSHTPRPTAFPAPFDKLASPSLKGHAKRVLLMPPQLSPARRVPVKQKRSQLTTAGKQFPFGTPTSSRRDNVQFATPKSSRVDNVSKAAGQNDNGKVMQHHDVHKVDVNYNKKNLEESAWPKRVLASTPQQSPFATPISSRVEHVLTTASQNNGVSGGKMMQRHDSIVKHGREKLDRLELLNRMLASVPQLSSPARRVPLRQKQKQPIKSLSPLHHKEKQQSSIKKSLSEIPKTSKSGHRKKKTCQNEAAVLDAKKQAAGGHQKATKKSLKKAPKGKGGNGTNKPNQQSLNNHGIMGGSSKQLNEDINMKYGDDSVDDNGNDIKHQCADGKQHEACDVDVGCDRYHDVEYSTNDMKQHCDYDGTKQHADDFDEDCKCQFDNGRDDQRQHEGRHVEVGGDVDTKHDNGTERHDDYNGDDDDIGVGSDDTDGEKQHGGEDTAKQNNTVNGVKQHNDDGTK